MTVSRRVWRSGFQPMVFNGRQSHGPAPFYAAEGLQTESDNTRLVENRLWAGGKALIWTPTQERDRKSFKIPIADSGKKQIHVAFGMTPESGKVAFELDGKPLQLEGDTETIDLNYPNGTLLRSFPLTTMKLDAGDHTLTIQWKGAWTGAAEPKVWIDFIWVQKR